MRYFGGKQRISKPLSQFLNSQLKEGQPFVDLFCGSCNVITRIDSNRIRIANDKHKYLISMWKALQEGWIPPDSISEEEYLYLKHHKDECLYLSGFVGFGCAFAGDWFQGYAKSKDRNYCLNAKNSTMKKLNNLKNVEFYNKDYRDLNIPNGSFVYCDIPYKNTIQHTKSLLGEFNHDEFYQWVKDNCNKYDIYVSEYKENVPNDFKIVWEYKSKKDIRDKHGIQSDTIEVLIRYNKNIFN